MPVQKVKRMLENEGVTYRSILHPVAYTAQEEAAASHVPGSAWAKTVVFIADGEPGLAVLPATHHVNPDRLAETLGASELRMATEDETAEFFPDCEVGAMPPFGGLWGVMVYVDESLSEEGRVAFHAGSHKESLEMAYGDFERVAQAEKADFADRGHKSSAYSF